MFKGQNYLRRSDEPKGVYKTAQEDKLNNLYNWSRNDFQTENFISGRDEWSVIATIEFERHLIRLRNTINKPMATRESFWYIFLIMSMVGMIC